MLKAVIFDFDGVIVNEYDKHYELVKKQIRGLSEAEFKKLFEGNVHVEREKLKERYTGFDMQFYFDKHKENLIIDSVIKKALGSLSKKYTLGIISSAREGGMVGSLKKSGLRGVFSFIWGYETHKLKTEKFRKAFRDFNLTPDQCIFIADTVGDVLEAKKVGVQAIAVDFGYHERERLEKSKPLKIISSFSEIEKAVDEISGSAAPSPLK